MILLAQSAAATAEALGGDAGWLGTGLLGLVLSWVMLKHLPDKDKLMLDMLKQFREELTAERAKSTEREDKLLAALRELKSSGPPPAR